MPMAPGFKTGALMLPSSAPKSIQKQAYKYVLKIPPPTYFHSWQGGRTRADAAPNTTENVNNNYVVLGGTEAVQHEAVLQ